MIQLASELTRRGFEAVTSAKNNGDGEKLAFNLPGWSIFTLSLTVLGFSFLMFMV